MGAKKQLKARVRVLERTDVLRRCELAHTDAELLRADERLRRQKAFSLALAERVLAAHDVLAHLAAKRAVVITETDSCPLG